MKKLKVVSILFLSFLMFTVVSCDDEPLESDILLNENQNNNQNQGSFQVDFDGQTYVADLISATILDDVINISGLRGNNGEIVVLTLTENNGVGTYQLGVSNGTQANVGAYSEENNSGDGTWVAVTDGMESQGEVTISEINEENQTMSGTFFFTGTNPSLMASKEFTNGVFTNVSYTGTLGSSNDTNTFFAKVDGVEFVEDAINGTFLSLAGTTTISIVATKNSLETIGVTLPGDVVPGTYNFETLSIPNAQYNLDSSSVFSGTGTVTITTHDVANNKLIGTFQFTAAPVVGTGNTYEITEGSFDVTYL